MISSSSSIVVDVVVVVLVAVVGVVVALPFLSPRAGAGVGSSPPQGDLPTPAPSLGFCTEKPASGSVRFPCAYMGAVAL